MTNHHKAIQIHWSAFSKNMVYISNYIPIICTVDLFIHRVYELSFQSKSFRSKHRTLAGLVGSWPIFQYAPCFLLAYVLLAYASNVFRIQNQSVSISTAFVAFFSYTPCRSSECGTRACAFSGGWRNFYSRGNIFRIFSFGFFNVQKAK